MPRRLLNTLTGRVVEYAEPEEIAPPHRSYASKDEKAQVEYTATRRKRLLDTLSKSRRWQTTTRPVSNETQRQRDEARHQSERRRIEAQVRAEYEQKLENERARMERQLAAQGPDTGGARPEPSQAELRTWARENGHEVPSRGRIPDEVITAYQQARAESGA